MKPKYRFAAALQYETSYQAPTVSVKGEDLDADYIVKVAQRYGIPVVERGELAHLLQEVEVDQEIPSELYEIVAVLFHELDKRKV